MNDVSKRLTGRAFAGILAAAGILVSSAALAQDAQPAQPTPPAEPAPAPQPAAEPAPALTTAPAPQIKREAPPIQAEPNIIDLKYMPPGSKREGTTTLKNTGSEPIRILRTTTSCHCTVAKLDKEVLEPGESVALSATLEAGKYLGQQQKQVRVFVEGYAVPLQVYVIGEVAYGVRANPVFVDAFQKRQGEITLESVDGKPFKVVCINTNAPTSADFKDYDPATGAAQTKYTIVFDYRETPDEQLPNWFVIGTDKDDAPLIDLRVINPNILPKVTGQEPWRLEEDRVLLGVTKPGQKVEFTANLKQASGFDRADQPTISVDNPELSVELVSATKTADGKMECKIAVTPKSPSQCLTRAKVTFSWLDYTFPLDVFTRVEP